MFNYNAGKIKDAREYIASNIDDKDLEALISAAVFGNEPGLGSGMFELVKQARASQSSLPLKKAKAKPIIKKESDDDSVSKLVQLPDLGQGIASTTLFANHVGIHWQLVVKKY